ncbi:MAG TPA: hypothetical protein VLI54_04105 [Bacillota bacterium]|nr:hypothetical protein [Bacillota bacterium]
MTRWISRPLTYMKRGLTSLFVCAVVALPIISLVRWAYGWVDFGRDQNKPTTTHQTSTAQVKGVTTTVDY